MGLTRRLAVMFTGELGEWQQAGQGAPDLGRWGLLGGEFSQGQPTENGKLVLGNAPDEPEQPVRIATAKTGKRPLPKNAK